jgi:hypothetical protein
MPKNDPFGEYFIEGEFDEEEERPLTGKDALKEVASRSEQVRKQQLKATQERNTVKTIEPPSQDVLEARQHFKEHYIEALQKLFPNSTGMKPFGPVQVDSVNQSQRIIERGGRLIKVEPRGFAKTSRTTNEALMGTLSGQLRYTLILASSMTKATDILDSIKTELVENQYLDELYPRITRCFQHLEERPQRANYQLYEGEHTFIKYSNDTIRLPNILGEPGAGGIIQVRPKDNVRGIYQTVKTGDDAGKRIRPQLAFFDDIQTKDDARNENTVETIIDTIKRDILQAGTHARRMSCIMCATPIEPDDVTCHFMNHPSWAAVVYKMLPKKPNREDMWLEEYQRRYLDFDKHDPKSRDKAIHDSLQFFKDNKETMLEGAEWSWEWAYGWDEDPQTEIHPVQHFYNIWINEGEKTARTECQCEVILEDEDLEDPRATVDIILSRRIDKPAFTCNLETRKIVTH